MASLFDETDDTEMRALLREQLERTAERIRINHKITVRNIRNRRDFHDYNRIYKYYTDIINDDTKTLCERLEAQFVILELKKFLKTMNRRFDKADEIKRENEIIKERCDSINRAEHRSRFREMVLEMIEFEDYIDDLDTDEKQIQLDALKEARLDELKDIVFLGHNNRDRYYSLASITDIILSDEGIVYMVYNGLHRCGSWGSTYGNGADFGDTFTSGRFSCKDFSEMWVKPLE